MKTNFKNRFSNHRIFRDITELRPDIVDAASITLPSDAILKVYECGESVIIHSKDSKMNCASISNSKGPSYVQDWEIEYMLKRILKENIEDVIIYMSPNGVIYLQTMEENTFVN